jgi:hypothetical protein
MTTKVCESQLNVWARIYRMEVENLPSYTLTRDGFLLSLSFTHEYKQNITINMEYKQLMGLLFLPS